MTFSILSLKRWAILIFAGFCLVLNIIAFLVYTKNERVAQSERWVEHTYEVLISNFNLYSALQDMQTAQRGYLLSPKDTYFETYEKNKRNSDLYFQELIDLTKDNAERQAQLQRYKVVAQQQQELMNAQIELKKKTGQILQQQMDQNRVYMQEVRTINLDITASEKKLLLQRINVEKSIKSDFVFTILASAGLAILGLLFINGIVTFLIIRRRQAEEELMRINKEMEGFTYIASHDLRSPLVNLKGFASEMKLGMEDISPVIDRIYASMSPADQTTIDRVLKQDIPDALKYIHSSVEKMDKLTNAILELSRIGRRALKTESINPERIAKHILDTLHHQITSRGIQVKVYPMPLVQTDQLSLEQIMGNIIDNSIKYLDPSRPGRIEIGAHRSYRETVFFVKDNGRGISEYDKNKIFEIYRRGGNNSDVPGEGMGMAYVRTTLRRLGGRIWFEPNPDHGVTFYFTISNILKKDQK